MLLGLLAEKQHGKDTFADKCVAEYGFKKMTFAGPLKEACRILFMFDDSQLYGERKEVESKYWEFTPRAALQYIGTDLIRNQMSALNENIGQNFWLQRFRLEYIPGVPTVISDVRFQNEVDYIHKLGGIVIKIIRPPKEIDICDNDRPKHESEQGIAKIKDVECTVMNEGTLEEYYEKIEQIMKELQNNAHVKEVIISSG